MHYLFETFLLIVWGNMISHANAQQLPSSPSNAAAPTALAATPNKCEEIYERAKEDCEDCSKRDPTTATTCCGDYTAVYRDCMLNMNCLSNPECNYSLHAGSVMTGSEDREDWELVKRGDYLGGKKSRPFLGKRWSSGANTRARPFLGKRTLQERAKERQYDNDQIIEDENENSKRSRQQTKSRPFLGKRSVTSEAEDDLVLADIGRLYGLSYLGEEGLANEGKRSRPFLGRRARPFLG